MTNIRVGIGYDIHQLQTGLPFILGGVHLDAKKGIVAHSDGDILFHAISDALLGAAGLGDIGCYFPDDDPKYKNMDSAIILSEILLKLKKLSYLIVNIDITLVLERPKLKSLLPDIKISAANCLNIDLHQLNIKATTSERMGFIGQENGVACYAVVLK